MFVYNCVYIYIYNTYTGPDGFEVLATFLSKQTHLQSLYIDQNKMVGLDADGEGTYDGDGLNALCDVFNSDAASGIVDVNFGGNALG